MAKRIALFFIICFVIEEFLMPQAYHGITGLLQTPCAESDSSGTFYGGVSWVDKAMLPNMGSYGDGIPFSAPSYTIGMTVWTWLQLSYTGTICKMHKNDDPTQPMGYYNEDRHFNLKLRPLQEGKWWPAVAIGWDDIGNFKTLKINTKITDNSFFENLYISVSKHFDIRGTEIGAHLAYRYYPSERNKDRRGIAGGITIRPSFFRHLRGIVEWDGIGVNAGADVLLWKRLFAQVSLGHGTGFSGGVGYRYQIPF